MATSFPTISVGVTPTGFQTTDFPTVQALGFTAARQIFGSDIYIDANTQQGAFLSFIARIVSDMAGVAEQVYASYSPQTAQGSGLSSAVKINNMTRESSSNSTCDVLIVGVAGTTITNGVVRDTSGNNWDLPASVVIPVAGQITVTATAEQTGALNAPIGTLTTKVTDTFGWQTVTNPSAAAPGQPVETDSELRDRQANSTELSAQGIPDAILGNVRQLAGVERVMPYENPSYQTDSNGIPSHSISYVVEGGDTQAIANTLQAKKNQAVGTYGTTQATVVDIYGLPHTISFFRPTYVQISFSITLKALLGFSSATTTELKNELTTFINTLDIGSVVEWAEAVGVVALLNGSTDAKTFKVVSMAINGLVGQDIPILFNQAAQTSPAQIVVTVT